MVDADLGITKDVDPSSDYVGEQVLFTITVTNHGPGHATGVRVQDLLPSGLEYAGCTAPEDTWYDPVSGIWHVGDLEDDANVQLLIDAEITAEGQMFNVASIASADQFDPNTTNNADMETVTGEAPPPVEPPEPVTSVSLDSGWNLISLPLVPNDPSIDTVLSDIQADVNGTYGIWTWDACVPAWYSSYPEDSTWAEGLDYVVDGAGYWIYMDSSGSFDVDGYEVPTGNQLPSFYPVCKGWNLIGFKSVTAKPASEYLTGIEYGDNYIIIYSYKNGAYSVIQPDDQFEPGLGYWIAIKDTGRWPDEEGTIFP